MILNRKKAIELKASLIDELCDGAICEAIGSCFDCLKDDENWELVGGNINNLMLMDNIYDCVTYFKLTGREKDCDELYTCDECGGLLLKELDLSFKHRLVKNMSG